MSPKFELNEVVVLQSIQHPELNGEYTILKLKDGEYMNTQTNEFINSFVYDLGIDHGTGHWWFEEALRKRHQKGDMSFRELMSGLKTNIQERA